MELIFILNLCVLINDSKQFEISKLDDCSQFYLKAKLVDMDKMAKRMILKTLMIKNFDNFSQIKFECIQNTNNSQNNLKINLIPSQGLKLTNDLKLKFDNSLLEKYYFSVDLVFNNIQKIKINLDIFKISKINLFVKFDYSHFSLDLNETDCVFNNAYKFTTFQSLQSFGFTRVKYEKTICPLIFYNCTLGSVSFGSISESFILKNVLNFKKINQSVNSYIDNLYINGHDIKINKNLLDLNIFNEIRYFFISGNIKSIDWNLIGKLKNLVYLSLDIYQTHIFFYQNYKYMEKLNQTLSNLITIWLTNRDNYSFPVKDFCVFLKFPRLTQIRIETSFYQAYACNCVLFWISGDCGSTEKYSKCEYERLVNNCEYFQTKKPVYKKDFTRIFKWNYLLVGALFEYLSFGGYLFFCSSAILIHVLVLKVIKDSKKILEKEKNLTSTLFNLMTLNSIVIILYCCLQMFHLFNSCPLVNGLVCSPFYGNVIIQYYEIYLVDFFGSFLKTLSNILNILISVFRSIIIDKNSRLFKIYFKISLIKNFKLKMVFVIVFLIVLLLANIDKLNASIASIKLGYFDPDYYGFPMRNSFIHSDMVVFNQVYYYSVKTKVENKYFFLFIINIVFNGFFLWLILLASDLFLLLKFRALMNKSQHIWSNMNETPDSSKRHIQILKIKQIKTSAKIWFNNFILLIFRLLELCSISFIFIMVIKYDFCQDAEKICDNYFDFSNLFYIMSCSYLIVIYYTFNKPFRICLKKIFKFDQFYTKINSFLLYYLTFKTIKV